MAGLGLLIGIGIVATIYSPVPITAVEEATCAQTQLHLGLCSTALPEGVVLEGTETFPGSVPGPRGGGAPRNFEPPLIACRLVAGPPVTNSCDVTPEAPTVTIRDIATFIPTPGQQRMEPDGWTVAGLDTNFFALTDAHIVNGTLLGRPADVRFTPVSYQWAYGDGASATKPSKGGTWAALGIREFDPTPTSHVYAELGDYTITLDIVFTAEYRFDGGGWRPVVGSLVLPANDLHIRVGTAKTVLVAANCRANPSGPGC